MATLAMKVPTQDGELDIEVMQCPCCQGIFAVDTSYLDEVTEVVHCPMCCEEVLVCEEDEISQNILIVKYEGDE